MQIHQMLTQPQLLVYASVLKPRQPVHVLGAEFQFIHTPKKCFFGITDHWAAKETPVKVSHLEKTVIDGLRQPEYCGGLSEVAKGLWMRHDEELRELKERTKLIYLKAFKDIILITDLRNGIIETNF